MDNCILYVSNPIFRHTHTTVYFIISHITSHYIPLDPDQKDLFFIPRFHIIPSHSISFNSTQSELPNLKSVKWKPNLTFPSIFYPAFPSSSPSTQHFAWWNPALHRLDDVSTQLGKELTHRRAGQNLVVTCVAKSWWKHGENWWCNKNGMITINNHSISLYLIQYIYI